MSPQEQPATPQHLLLVYSLDAARSEALCRLLEASGLSFDRASGPQGPQELLGSGSYSMLLLLPGEGEAEFELGLLGQLKADNSELRDLPVVVIYPEGTENSIAMASLAYGAYDYMVEPYNEIQLLTKITVLAMLKHTELEYRAMSVQDRLTGLYDRRYLQLRMGEEISRARRHRVPLACLLLDVDCLRAVNESYGMDAGDELLRSLAGRVNEDKRGSDVLGRYGSDCFIMLLWNADGAGAQVVAERLQVHSSRLSLAFDQNYRASISVGVAVLGWEENELTQRHEGGTDWQVLHLLERAELSLRFAQQRGGGAVVIDEPRTGIGTPVVSGRS